MALNHYFESYYNEQSIHTDRGFTAPVQYEKWRRNTRVSFWG